MTPRILWSINGRLSETGIPLKASPCASHGTASPSRLEFDHDLYLVRILITESLAVGKLLQNLIILHHYYPGPQQVQTLTFEFCSQHPSSPPFPPEPRSPSYHSSHSPRDSSMSEMDQDAHLTASPALNCLAHAMAILCGDTGLLLPTAICMPARGTSQQHSAVSD